MPRLRRQSKRQRRRAREAQHDLRHQYREGDLPFQNGIGVLTIEDPYSGAARVDADGNLDVRARLEQARHGDGTVAQGAPGWTPPKRPLVTVITALRDDALGRMFARRQIDQPQYLAGRAYQECADRAVLGSVKSIDLSRTPVSGGALPEILTDAKKRAMKRLRQVEERVVHRYGVEGLSVCRAVLSEGQSVEATARARGAKTEREVRFWSGLFRRCLDVLAATFGFGGSSKRPQRQSHAEQDPTLDPARYAGADELSNPAFRSGHSS